jgi:protein tyrosine phosphatase (PTP) superfamily phosphohydrolase (DUF442 family)
MDQPINFHQITETIGTAGQPTEEQLREIANQGYSTVINLAMHNSDHAIPHEGNLVSALGMSYIHIPVPFDKPEAGHLQKFIRVMDALDGEKIFVHCALNARVSVFIYKYLTLRKGCEDSSATTPLLQRWQVQMDDAWKAMMALRAEELGM